MREPHAKNVTLGGHAQQEAASPAPATP